MLLPFIPNLFFPRQVGNSSYFGFWHGNGKAKQNKEKSGGGAESQKETEQEQGARTDQGVRKGGCGSRDRGSRETKGGCGGKLESEIGGRKTTVLYEDDDTRKAKMKFLLL